MGLQMDAGSLMVGMFLGFAIAVASVSVWQPPPAEQSHTQLYDTCLALMKKTKEQCAAFERLALSKQGAPK